MTPSWTIRLLAFLALAGAVAAAEQTNWLTFEDVTKQAGIRFKHSFGDHNLSNIVEGTGPGGTLFDYDGDGYLDIYLVNGRWLSDVSDNLGRDLRGVLFNALYHNNGDGTFTDVTAKAGVAGKGYGMGATAADYDNDGDLDLYVSNYGPNELYRNNGNGTFTDVPTDSGLADSRWSMTAVWFDYNGDGWLDVYVPNYLEYDAGAFRDFYAADGYPGPLSYKGQPDALYRNNKDGTFTDVTKETGMYFADGRSMGAIAADLNNDGRTDVFVTNDAMPNSYWLNVGDGTFRNEGERWGLAFGEGGQGVSSMGPAVADLNRDGLLDVFIPDMGYNCLLMNKGKMFVDATAQTTVAVTCAQYTGWGGLLVDFDNDGYPDMFVANGDPHHEYPEEAVLLRNDRQGKFVDVADRSGAWFRSKHVSRGAAAGDFDNDGDMDILVFNLNASPSLLRNDGGNRNRWLTVAPKLAGTGADAVGARVTVTMGKMRLVEEVYGTVGYLSQSDLRAHFGLGEANQADLIEVRWPNGKTTTLRNVEANQILEVIQDTQ